MEQTITAPRRQVGRAGASYPGPPGCTARSTIVRKYGRLDVSTDGAKAPMTEGNKMSIEQSNSGQRHFLMTIVPTNTSGIGDPACEL